MFCLREVLLEKCAFLLYCMCDSCNKYDQVWSKIRVNGTDEEEDSSSCSLPTDKMSAFLRTCLFSSQATFAETTNVTGTGRDGTRSWTSRAETKLNYEFKVVIRKLFLFFFFFFF